MFETATKQLRCAGAAWIFVLAAAGCIDASGSTPDPDAAKPATTKLSDSQCRDLEHAAQADAQAAVTSNLACKANSDCVNVRFAASCFEACTRTIATSGSTALQTALDRVEAAQCVTYHDGGCTFIIPPCVPPLPAECGADGMCGR